MDKRKSASQIEREIQSALAGDATLFYPGGSGGGGSRQKKPGTPVVKPHARTNAGCRECSRLHSLEQHAAHGEGTKMVTKMVTRKAKSTKAKKTTKKTAKTIKAKKATTKATRKVSINPSGLAGKSTLQLVREAVRQIGPEGRYGDQKVFIISVYRAIPPHALGMTLSEFKRWLVEANRNRVLNLARADLVGAMDRNLVRDSEIEDLGSTFHFILADSV